MDRFLLCVSHLNFLGSWHQCFNCIYVLSCVQYHLSADICLRITDFDFFMCVYGSSLFFFYHTLLWATVVVSSDFCMLFGISNVEILLRWALNIFMLQTWVAQTVKKSRCHLNIFGARRVTWSKFLIEDTNIRYHSTKFSHQGDLAPRICASLLRWAI